MPEIPLYRGESDSDGHRAPFPHIRAVRTRQRYLCWGVFGNVAKTATIETGRAHSKNMSDASGVSKDVQQDK